MMTRLLSSLLLLALLLPAIALASLSTRYQEWGDGPAKWIMTTEEQRAWKGVRSDEAAIDFIDLFWARRDPTAGTPRNEFKDEFEQRVAHADKNWTEPRTTGSLTDRGRVYIVLGTPTDLGAEAGGFARSGGVGDPAGGRDLGARETWLWEKEDARQFNMPKIEVVFIATPGSDRVTRDTMRADFLRAAPVAIRKAVVHPDLKSLPDWAIRGGLDPRIEFAAPADRFVVAESSSSTEAAPAAQSQLAAEGAAPASAASQAASATRSARLILLADAEAIDPEARRDPLASLRSKQSFTTNDDLGWLVQYCSSSASDPLLTYSLRLSGIVAGRRINRAAPPDQIVPEPIRAAPGCYLLRGLVPLSGMEGGSYTLAVEIEDPATGREESLSAEFTLE
jgi:GWxTD domain-containing protein